MPKRPEDALADMIANLPKTTGKPLEEWQGLINTAGLSKHKEIVEHLKSQHGLTHGFAHQIALRATPKSPTQGDPVDELFAGAKANLRPIHDALMTKINAFGNDVDVAPKKSYLSLRRSKQFAIIQPSTATRLDVGINLKQVEAEGRLEASGSFNAMLSHRVRLEKIEDVDSQLEGWLKQAYDSA